jgi:hypothetical protein
MTRIDLCKLRPGDLIFTRLPAWRSRGIALGTWSLYSHAMIVVYPDVWFETDGAGSGFKLIEDVSCFEIQTDSYAILADLPYKKLSVVRVGGSAPSPDRVLEVVRDHIALAYPGWVEFIPLFLPLRPFPRIRHWLMASLSRQSEEEFGGYCSQMVSQMLRDLYGSTVGSQDDHVSPGTLRRRILKSGAEEVDCFRTDNFSWKRSDRLKHVYDNLLKVTKKLKGYQYPRDRDSFEAALAETFQELGIEDDPRRFSPAVDQLKAMLTKPNFFRMHAIVWPRYFS